MDNRKSRVMKLKSKIRKYLFGLMKVEKIDTNQKSNITNNDFTKFEIDVISKVSNFTMTSPARIVTLIRATEYIVKNNIEGDFVECGVWKGGSVGACVLTLNQLSENNRKIWLFDTFEGMNTPSEVDYDINGKLASDRLDVEDKETSWIWAKAQLDAVKNNVYSFGYPTEKIDFIKGLVEETLISNEIPEKISLLRLDTDWYESTKIELEVLYPRLVSGGVLIIDDYGHWNGCRKAVDEFFDSMEFSPFLNRIDYTGRIIIKP
jgi:O-methyltransferase